MSTVIFPVFDEAELRYLKPGRVCNLKHATNDYPTNDPKQKWKCSTNTYIYPSESRKQRYKFHVEVIGGKTKAEHCALRDYVRVAAKLVTDRGSTPPPEAMMLEQSFLTNTASTGQIVYPSQRMEIRFALIDAEKYDHPYHLQFMIELPKREKPKEVSIGPVVIKSDPSRLTPEYTMPFTGRRLKIWVQSDTSVQAPNGVTAKISRTINPNPLQEEVYARDSLPVESHPTQKTIELSSGESLLPDTVPFTVAIDVTGNLRVTMIGKLWK